MPDWFRRPPFRGHGRTVIACACAYELVALIPESPVPTISDMVQRHRALGVLLLGILAHHWYVELEDIVETAVAEAIADV